jgi:hypothetical protein
VAEIFKTESLREKFQRNCYVETDVIDVQSRDLRKIAIFHSSHVGEMGQQSLCSKMRSAEYICSRFFLFVFCVRSLKVTPQL